MCSSATLNQDFVTALQNKVAAEKPFTAYDVTLEARRITGQRVAHYGDGGVRNFVMSEVGGIIPASWGQTLIRLKNGKDAIVYHPDSVDPWTYDEADNAPNTNTVTAPVQVQTPISPAGVTTSPFAKKVKVTEARRLQIPKKVMEQVKPTGGSYDIELNGCLLVCRIPNEDGRIRIGAKELDKAGIFKSANVSADVTRNSIIVTPA